MRARLHAYLLAHRPSSWHISMHVPLCDRNVWMRTSLHGTLCQPHCPARLRHPHCTPHIRYLQVYGLVDEEIKQGVHALRMKLKAPAEVGEK